jgi:hypothetical protein
MGPLEDAFAENRLSDDEQMLLSKLKGLKHEIDQMRPDDVGAWRRLARQVEHLNEIPAIAVGSAGDGPKVRH